MLAQSGEHAQAAGRIVIVLICGRRVMVGSDVDTAALSRLLDVLELCIVSWRIFRMTMLNRSVPDAAPDLALTRTEMRLLDHFVPDKGKPSHRKSISRYLIKIARLGGYFARASIPAGNIVMWR